MVDVEFKPAPGLSAQVPRKEMTLLKCVVLGSSNVGKTSLLTQFVYGKFDPTRRVTTGADFASKVMQLGDEAVRLVIWDTAGQERFHHGTLGHAFYRGADGALLVYDTTDIRTFEQIEMWRGELLQRVEGPPEDFPVVVVGNKIDVPSDTRDHEQAAVMKWCRDLGVGLCLASAKDGTGVAVAMEAIALLALENKRRKLAANPGAAAAAHRSAYASGRHSDTLTLDDIRGEGRDHSGGGCCK